MEQTEISTKSLTGIVENWSKKQIHSFEELSTSVLLTHQTAQSGAIRAVNQMATLRNWLIGCYIVEYEQNGSDRAKYGDRLLKRLEERVNTKGLNETLFLASRRFYIYYPQIREIFLSYGISAMPSPKSCEHDEISATPSPKLDITTINPTSSDEFKTSPELLVSKLSFSHIREIMIQNDPLARFFYETECIKGTWSVKELRRQISTNLYFRSGVSKNPKELLTAIKQLADYIEKNSPEIKGFSDKNLWRMKQFYETYNGMDEKLSPLVRHISWANNLIIMSRAKTEEERAFYIEEQYEVSAG